MEIVTLELPKLPKVPDETKRWYWAKFLDTKDREVLEMLSQVEPTLGKATNLLECLSHSDEVRAEYEARERAIRDYNMYINDAREEGIEIGEKRGMQIGEQRGIQIGEQRGMQIGEQKGIQETIKKLLKAGMNSNQLAPMLGLSEQQIQELSTQ